jgi:hypothetical protein
MTNEKVSAELYDFAYDSKLAELRRKRAELVVESKNPLSMSLVKSLKLECSKIRSELSNMTQCGQSNSVKLNEFNEKVSYLLGNFRAMETSDQTEWYRILSKLNRLYKVYKGYPNSIMNTDGTIHMRRFNGFIHGICDPFDGENMDKYLTNNKIMMGFRHVLKSQTFYVEPCTEILDAVNVDKNTDFNSKRGKRKLARWLEMIIDKFHNSVVLIHIVCTQSELFRPTEDVSIEIESKRARLKSIVSGAITETEKSIIRKFVELDIVDRTDAYAIAKATGIHRIKVSKFLDA